MGTDTRVTIDGVEVAPTMDPARAIAEAVQERPPARDYLIVRDGTPEAAIRWDGVTEFDPGEGVELHPADDWKGDPYTGPPEPEEVRARRTVEERLDTLIGHLRDDLRGFDGMTAAQRQAAQKRAIRAVLLLARVTRGDFTGDAE